MTLAGRSELLSGWYTMVYDGTGWTEAEEEGLTGHDRPRSGQEMHRHRRHHHDSGRGEHVDYADA